MTTAFAVTGSPLTDPADTRRPSGGRLAGCRSHAVDEGSATHSINSDQRRIALTPTPVGANSYDVLIPADRGTVVPGSYLLFALDQHGTPSIATWLEFP